LKFKSQFKSVTMTSSSPRLRAIITGASSGIGKATALAFADTGIAVALVSRSVDKLTSLAQTIRHRGGEAQIYPLDLSQLDRVKDQIAAIASEFGPIDILVNSAGMGYTQTLDDTPLSDWQRVIDLNLTSVVQTVLGVLPGMRDRAQGTIINLTSIAAQSPFPEWGAYCVSKAGLAMFSKVLAAEEKSHGIRVVNIAPGAVNTALWDTDTVQADFDRQSMLKPETVAQLILQAASLPLEAVIEEMTILPSAGAL
jgi:NADP-dependent 3-hydroxy acid dehydrogenase YdfG